MIHAYKAPVAPEDIGAIVDYLTRQGATEKGRAKYSISLNR
jgi:hypothetical protein